MGESAKQHKDAEAHAHACPCFATNLSATVDPVRNG